VTRKAKALELAVVEAPEDRRVALQGRWDLKDQSVAVDRMEEPVDRMEEPVARGNLAAVVVRSGERLQSLQAALVATAVVAQPLGVQ